MAAAIDPVAALRMGATVLLLAFTLLSWVWLRRRGGDRRDRLAALTALTLFLTFDLVAFGAYTRLSDSGLGCPDWPGCYAQASPIGAHAEIHAAQAAQPSGPVTWSKAWIEMIHRYLAATVGALIVVLAVASWLERRRTPISPWWPTLTLVWVIVQGLFGKYTVTLKLYPAIVTLHLLGGIVLLMLLARQREAYRPRSVALPASLHAAVWLTLALVGVQIALGGWVSTNYAVLACDGFPLCNGHLWPDADFGAGFTILRGLGVDAAGAPLPFDALVAIHLAHRAFAVVAAVALAWLAWALARRRDAAPRRWGRTLALLLLLQLGSGLSNVVLDWPLPAALIHTAGAAAIVLVLTLLGLRSRARNAVAA